jgi:NAD(P)-dependent dehydrogenase (short-subunit alcohol dehydrogenase family)
MSGVLAGRTAIVTGGTGALGSAVTRLFLSEGARVAVPYREPAGFERLRATLPDAESPLSGAMVDLTAEAEVEDFFESVAEDRGGLDVLVNTAGGFGGGRPAHETPWEIWQKQIDINLRTAAVASRAAVPRMLARGGGAIVNLASRAAVGDGKNVAAYAAAKRGVLALTDAMAAELREQRITVNAVMPSTIDTPENRTSMPKADASRFVPPEQIARVILFLCGPDAREISGAHVPVYGRA